VTASTTHRADQVRQAGHDVPDAPVQAGRAHPHQHLVLTGHRLVDVPVLEDVLGAAGVLDGLVDVVFGEIDLPSGEEGWRTAMRRRAISAREALRRHPRALATT
jgi:hypothetical protein